MFRKVGALVAFLSFVSLEAQEVKDYNYIIIPENFTDFEKNKYQLKNRLNHFLKQKKYTVVSFNQQNWPTELKNDPCLALTADLKKVKSLTTNKIELEFSNCSKQVVETIEATSKIKDFEPGFQEAVELAVQKLPISNPTVKPNLANASAKPKNIDPQPIEITVKANEEVNMTNLLTDGVNNYQLIELNNGSFMIMNENATQVVAKFEKALKPGVYRVAVTKGNSSYSSIGYYNNTSFSFEVLENNQWKEVILTEKK